MAGPAAQARYTGRRDHRGAGAQWGRIVGGDYDTVHDLLLRLTTDEREQVALQRWLWRRAQVYVERNWKEITRVATALLERETLTGAELVDVIWPNLPPLPAPKG